MSSTITNKGGVPLESNSNTNSSLSLFIKVGESVKKATFTGSSLEDLKKLIISKYYIEEGSLVHQEMEGKYKLLTKDSL
jgi:hypothetical protein